MVAAYNSLFICAKSMQSNQLLWDLFVLDQTEADSTVHHKMCVFILILLSFWEFSNLVCEAGLVAS